MDGKELHNLWQSNIGMSRLHLSAHSCFQDGMQTCGGLQIRRGLVCIKYRREDSDKVEQGMIAIITVIVANKNKPISDQN